jgi:thiamine-phosphate pyrophosphorylase
VKSQKAIDFRLYLITDRKLFTDTDSLFNAVEEALKGGVTAVQLREKDLEIRELLEMAYALRKLTERYSARLFINDRVDVALSVRADGVHLGQASIPAHAARKVAGDALIIGVSTHGTEAAVHAEDDGADFVTVGPVYETPSKMMYGNPLGTEIIKETKSRISIPLFAIGGIKLNNVDQVMRSGADGISLISGILASDEIQRDSELFMECLDDKD